MTIGLAAILVVFSMLAYGGAGGCLAVARGRAAEHERDLGMVGVATLLLGFGILCSAVLGGIAAVLALGAPGVAGVYLFTAQRLGLFQVRSGPLTEVTAEESHRTG
jgi:hypothetical protein